MPIATKELARESGSDPAAPKLVWSRIDRPRSFADLPTASAAFRTWLRAILILGVMSVLAIALAELLGLPGGSIGVIAVFILAVAALNYPSSAPRRVRLKVIK